MLNKIVVPLDGSELSASILPYVMQLARPFGSTVYLVHAVDNEPHSDLYRQRPVADVVHAMVQEAAVYLERTRSAFEAQGEKVMVECVVGRPADAVLDYAQRIGADLIALATRGQTGFPAGLLGVSYGRVADRMIHGPINVLAIRPGENGPDRDPGIRRLIVPLDGSPLAEQALPYAVAIASKMGEPITLLKVTDVPAFVGVAGAAGRLEAEIMTAGRRYLGEKAEELRAQGVHADVEVTIGSAASQIAQLARKTDRSLVVMTSHGRSGIARWLMGSVTEMVLRDAGDPVLIVQSQGA